MMRLKSIFRSKTFWLNVLHVAVQVQPFIPVNHTATAVIASVIGVANRLVTDGPVSLTGS